MKKILALLLLFIAIAAQSQTPSKELLKTITFNGLKMKLSPVMELELTPYYQEPLNIIPTKLNRMVKCLNSRIAIDGQMVIKLISPKDIAHETKQVQV